MAVCGVLCLAVTSVGDKPLIQLDVGYVFQRLGGPKGIVALCDRHLPGHSLQYAAVQMWKQRNRVSCQWLPSLIYVLHRENVSLSACFWDDEEFVADTEDTTS